MGKNDSVSNLLVLLVVLNIGKVAKTGLSCKTDDKKGANYERITRKMTILDRMERAENWNFGIAEC